MFQARHALTASTQHRAAERPFRPYHADSGSAGRESHAVRERDGADASHAGWSEPVAQADGHP